MKISCRLLTCIIVVQLFSVILAQDGDFLYGFFPDYFQWGTATASYQIEGGWNADGKGENIWDAWTHEGGNVANNDTGDVACDSYNRWTEDIAILREMEVNFYRFSLSWSRLMPTGEGETNQAGIDYYNGLIDGLLDQGIEPMVTLYHWDLPQALQENYGGWESEEMIPIFTEYARLCFQSFGDRVKLWLTFNEPWVVTALGYESGEHPPGIFNPGRGSYLTAHNFLRAHAEAWHLYDDEFRAQQQGRISITLDSDWKEPYTNKSEDIEATDRAREFKLGWFANPIYVNGDYPEIMKNQVEYKSFQQGLNESRMPSFTEAEKERILGTWDFFGLNHYSATQIEDAPNNLPRTTFFSDQEIREYRDPDWPSTGTEWMKVVPWGLRNLLNYIRDKYDNPPVIITENGCSDRNATLQDDHRVNYFNLYTNNVLRAILLDGCNVTGYTAWSVMDNFEWNEGYDEKFGLHHVDFSNPERPRTQKASARFYRQLILDNGFPDPNATTTQAFDIV